MSETQPSVGGEIVFGTPVALQTAVSVLEVPFPSTRTLHWVPKKARNTEAVPEAGAEDSALVITQEVILATSRHVSQTLKHEIGGFLLGNRYRCPTGRNYVIIDQFMEGQYTEADEVSLHFTHESWRRLEDQLGTTFLGKALVGWYHSHPRMDVFLSRDDLSIHERRFGEPWKSALVLEPEKHFGGFFCWRGGKLNQHAPVDFYEMLRDDTRQTVVAWENYTGVDPLKKVTPPLASTNTKSVGPRGDERPPQLPPARTPRRALLSIAAAGVLGVTLGAWYIKNRQPDTPPKPPDTPTQTQAPTTNPETHPEQDAPVGGTASEDAGNTGTGGGAGKEREDASTQRPNKKRRRQNNTAPAASTTSTQLPHALGAAPPKPGPNRGKAAAKPSGGTKVTGRK